MLTDLPTSRHLIKYNTHWHDLLVFGGSKHILNDIQHLFQGHPIPDLCNTQNNGIILNKSGHQKFHRYQFIYIMKFQRNFISIYNLFDFFEPNCVFKRIKNLKPYIKWILQKLFKIKKKGLKKSHKSCVVVERERERLK